MADNGGQWPEAERVKRLMAAGGDESGPAVGGDAQPLDVLLAVMRDEGKPLATRIACAKEAAPYCHAKLASTVVTHTTDAALPELLRLMEEARCRVYGLPPPSRPVIDVPDEEETGGEI